MKTVEMPTDRIEILHCFPIYSEYILQVNWIQIYEERNEQANSSDFFF